MIDYDYEDAERMEQLIVTAITTIFREQNFSRFMQWSRASIPQALAFDEDDLPFYEQQRLATLLGRAIWNATPLPKRGYRPQPVALPEPDAPCLCGSGLDFKHCCAGYEDEAPEMPEDFIWELLLERLSEKRLQAALHHRAIPEHLLAQVGDRWLDAGRPAKVVQLLEPLFEQALDTRDERFAAALEVLCDAYDAQRHRKKKHAFLDRMTCSGSRPLQAAAWQRWCRIFMDEQRFERAESAFAQAQRQAPDNPATALLEMTLLVVQRRLDLAIERARVWKYRFQRQPNPNPDLIEFLRAVIQDPEAALATTYPLAFDLQLIRLYSIIEQQLDAPLPLVADIVPVETPAAAAEHQMPLFAITMLPPPLPLPRSGVLCPRPPGYRQERQWRRHWTLAKPTGTQLDWTADQVIKVWQRTSWLDALSDHPESIDQLDILDDLTSALAVHPEAQLPWVVYYLQRPLYQRAKQLIERILDAHPLTCLPWSAPSNRPALRLLLRLYQSYLQHERDIEAACEALEWLLQLNPQDDHEVRAELINHYLRAGEHTKALDVTRRFPNDYLADTVYGEVLALYCLGERQAATFALRGAIQRLPWVISFLIRERVRRPPLKNPPLPGSDAQAWRYRVAMRDLWVGERGMLKWLQGIKPAVVEERT